MYECDIEWLLEEDIYVTRYQFSVKEDLRFLATDTGRRWAAIVSFREKLLSDPPFFQDPVIIVNGEPADFGDDYPAMLGFGDQVSELPADQETFIAAENDPGRDEAPNQDRMGL